MTSGGGGGNLIPGGRGQYLSFIYLERGGLGEILPEMMIFPEGAP